MTLAFFGVPNIANVKLEGSRTGDAVLLPHTGAVWMHFISETNVKNPTSFYIEYGAAVFGQWERYWEGHSVRSYKTIKVPRI